MPEVAGRTLGDTPSVAAIISARDALLGLARERGVERPTLFVALERRDASDGRTTHVVAFELCAGPTHPSFERDLRRLLAPAELAALGRERICEARGPRQGHQHH